MSKINCSEALLSQVRELAAQAYGHDTNRAGAGRIGMIGGHVVKFNTHIGERRSKAGSMTSMRECCDALRAHLGKIASRAYGGAAAFSDGMKKILGKLGLDADGTLRPANRSLLSRSVVAQFIDQLKRDSEGFSEGLKDAKGTQTVKHSMLTDVMNGTVGDIVKAELAEARKKGGALSADKITSVPKSLGTVMTGLLSGEMTLADAQQAIQDDNEAKGPYGKIDEEGLNVLNGYLADLVVRHADVRYSCARAQVTALFADTAFESVMGQMRRSEYVDSDNGYTLKAQARIQERMEKKVTQLFNASELSKKILSGELKSARNGGDYLANEEFKRFFSAANEVVKDAVKTACRRFDIGFDDSLLQERSALSLGYAFVRKEGAEDPVMEKQHVYANTLREKVENRIRVLDDCRQAFAVRRAVTDPIGLGFPVTAPVNDEDVKNEVAKVMKAETDRCSKDGSLTGLEFDAKKSGLATYALTWTLKFGDETVKKNPGESEKDWAGRVERALMAFFKDDPETGVLVDRMFKNGLEGGLGTILKSEKPNTRMPVRIGMDERDGPTINLAFSKSEDGGYQITETREKKGPTSFQHVTNGKNAVNWRMYRLQEDRQANADEDVIRTEYSFVLIPRRSKDERKVPLVPVVCVPSGKANFTFRFSEGLYEFDEQEYPFEREAVQ